MALPALQQKALPGFPPADTALQRDVLAASRRAPTLQKRTELDGRRPTGSLRRVKDSKEELRRTRARGASNGTVESSTTNSGRSFTVANVNHGIIYLRYVWCTMAVVAQQGQTTLYCSIMLRGHCEASWKRWLGGDAMCSSGYRRRAGF